MLEPATNNAGTGGSACWDRCLRVLQASDAARRCWNRHPIVLELDNTEAATATSWLPPCRYATKEITRDAASVKYFFCYNQIYWSLLFCWIFAGSIVNCCWNWLFVLLQSNFLKFDVCGIFAGTIIIFCWNRLFVLLRRIGWRFVISGILLEPVFFLAGTGIFFLLQLTTIAFLFC